MPGPRDRGGAGKRTWRAYLGTNATGNAPTQHARERIGTGPWQNAKGVVIARSVEELHGNNNLNRQTALTEKGETLNGAGDTPNLHDILTGSQSNGMALAGTEDRTCRNWTSSGAGSAMVGHHDRTGLPDDAASKSWNSSHATKGCSEEALRATGGGGLLVTFRGVLVFFPRYRRARWGSAIRRDGGSFTLSLRHAMIFFELYGPLCGARSEPGSK